MIYREEIRDLFTVLEDFHLAQCISADFGMGKGIAVEFNRRFNMKNKLRGKYPDYLSKWIANGADGTCILEGRVLNLVTKARYYQKPTYRSMRDALENVREICKTEGIRKIAMPTIGAGLDKLEWYRVSGIIQDVFKSDDIEILVCIRDYRRIINPENPL